MKCPRRVEPGACPAGERSTAVQSWASDIVICSPINDLLARADGTARILSRPFALQGRRLHQSGPLSYMGAEP